jgi:hypothetical protein
MVRVNDKIDYPFIIDTGAQAHVVPSMLLDMLAIEESNTQENTVVGASGVTTMKFLNLQSLSVGGFKISNTRAVINDLGITLSNKKLVAGVIGQDFLHRFVIDMDMENEIFSVYNNENWKLDDSKGDFHTLPFKLHEGFIVFEGHADDHPVNVLFDSGAGQRVVANTQLEKKLGILEKDKIPNPRRLRGIGGNALDSYLYQANKIKIDALEYLMPKLEIVDIPAFDALGLNDSPSINLPMKILSESRVIINYQTKQLFAYKK